MNVVLKYGSCSIQKPIEFILNKNCLKTKYLTFGTTVQTIVESLWSNKFSRHRRFCWYIPSDIDTPETTSNAFWDVRVPLSFCFNVPRRHHCNIVAYM